MNSIEKLKPCPFCGSDEIEYSSVWKYIHCYNCKIIAKINNVDERFLVIMWNTRIGDKDE